MTGGSVQLRRFRRALHLDGLSIEDAAEFARIAIGEAKLIAAEDRRNPPEPEAFELLDSPSNPPPAEGAASHLKDETMARGRNARAHDDDDGNGEIAVKDFAGAVRLFKNDILPAQSKVGEFAQEQSTAFKAIKKNCHIQPGAAKAAFKLFGMEDAKREDWLRSFNGLITELNIGLTSDLVDMAEGVKPGPAPVQSNKRPRPTLVTLSDGTETDLADAAEDLPEAAE